MRGRLGRSQAKALMAELIDIREALDRIITALNDNEQRLGREHRAYDDPGPDPEEIAAKFGIDTAQEGNQPPAWVRGNYGHRMEQP